MENKEVMIINTNSAQKELREPTERGVHPDPEVLAKAVRRRFSAEYKRRILQDVESCTGSGQIGSLLRREGLYFSHLPTWRRQAHQGTLQALSPRKRGPKVRPPDPAAGRLDELEKQIQRLRKKLKQAETIIEVQKKLSEILQIPLEAKEPEKL
jgi:transposase